MAAADFDVLSNIIAPLGFRNRRARKLIEMSKRYKEADWKSVEELPGIGPYAAAAWHIFVKGDVPSVCPEDHALTLWWHWYQKRKGDAT
jgi:methyl-CpG-binding domain protein 4